MCEWNVKIGPDESTRETDLNDNIMRAVRQRIRFVLWKVRVWDHGPDCRWAGLLELIAGGRAS